MIRKLCSLDVKEHCRCAYHVGNIKKYVIRTHASTLTSSLPENYALISLILNPNAIDDGTAAHDAQTQGNIDDHNDPHKIFIKKKMAMHDTTLQLHLFQ